MINLQDIEAAIQKLPTYDLAIFRQWFAKFDGDNWDQDIEQDIQAGRLDVLAAEAKLAHKNGETKEL